MTGGNMFRAFYIVLFSALLLLGCTVEEPDAETQSLESTPLVPAEQTANAAPPEVNQRPNFLLMITDDMAYTDLGAFGGADIPTPNLDSLAMQGVRLSNFHTNVSCAPTRSMLMSGTGNHEAGMGSQWALPEFVGRRGYEGLLTDRVASLPQRMQAEGYHTYMAGKWHLAGVTQSVLPSDRGFERSFALIPGGWDHFALEPGAEKPNVGPAPDVPYTEDGRILEEWPEDFYYSTNAYVDKLIGYLEEDQSSSQPFFAYFAPTAPHWPLQVHPDWKDRFVGAFDQGYEALCRERQQGAFEAGVLPDGVDMSLCPEIAAPWDELTQDEQALNIRTMELYAAMVAHLDTEFGRLLDYLEESGQLENTYIIYHNDNGPEGGDILDHRSILDRFDNSLENIGNPNSWVNLGQGWADAHSAPFRNQKSSPFEGGIRVPAFITPPRSVANAQQDLAQGRISSSMLTVMDVMPTIMELAGIEEQNYPLASEVLPIRGMSFAEVLSDTGAEIHASTEAIALDHAGLSYLIQGDWKIIRNIGEENWQLYNTNQDPSERRDMAMNSPEKLAELIALYQVHADSLDFQRRAP